jgi:acetoin utilization deacetylase AcuC-like enzyme
MDRPVVLHHPSSREHDTGPHPERVARIEAIEEALGGEGWLGWEERLSPAATREQLERVHPARYVTGIEELCLSGGGAIDADTLVVEGSLAAALHGAGGACALVDALLGEGAPAGASLHRPPGHHAEPGRAMGFCLFSTIAVAARHAQAAHGLSRVAVVDWDVHHGNGTQAALEASADALFVSVHESPLYPGTGHASETGVGEGEGFTVNVPVPGGSGDDVWCSVLEHVVAPVLTAYEPQLVLVSAGFDAHERDPLATCRVTDDGFAAMGRTIRRVGAELGVPVGLVLEGGYDLLGLVGGLRAAMLAVAAGAEPAPSLPVHPVAARARERQAAHWPALATP